MAIPRGRFYWDLYSGNSKTIGERARTYTKAWKGAVIGKGFDGIDRYGESLWDMASNCYAYVYGYAGTQNAGPHRIQLPPVDSNSGQVQLCLCVRDEVVVSMRPNETQGFFCKGGYHLNINPYGENSPVGYEYTYDIWYAYSGFHQNAWIYQSFGSNTYTINRCGYSDFNRRGTMSLLVTKGVHLSTGKASTLVLLPSEQYARDWSKFQFFIWNPISRTWITGQMSGIKQTLTDSSHILITPIELNGYSFPDVYFADATANPAFGAFCAAEQLREFDYNIKKIRLNETTYHIPITHSNQTVILINKSPDGITVDH